MKPIFEYLLDKKNKKTNEITFLPIDEILWEYGCVRSQEPMQIESNGKPYMRINYSYSKKLFEKFYSNIGEGVTSGWVNNALVREGKIDPKNNKMKVLVDTNYVEISIVDPKHFIDSAKRYNVDLCSIFISKRDKVTRVTYRDDELLETLINVIKYLLEKFNIGAEVETYLNRKKHK